MQGLTPKGNPTSPVTFTSGSAVMISALVTPQTPRHRFHLFSMGPPRHSAHETWCFRFITRTKIPPFIFQRLGLHYIVIVSSNGSLSHLGHWCCTEIYDFCFSLVTLARKLSHRSIEQHKDTWLIWFICVLCLLLLTRPKWRGSVVTCSLYEVQEIHARRGYHECPEVPIFQLQNYYYYHHHHHLLDLSFHSVAIVLTLVTNKNKYT